MAQRRTVEVTCDHCGRDKPDVQRRKLLLPHLGKNGRALTFDACKDCREKVPVAKWEELIPETPKTARGNLVVSEAVVRQAARGRR